MKKETWKTVFQIYLDRYCRLSGRDELHVVEHHKY